MPSRPTVSDLDDTVTIVYVTAYKRGGAKDGKPAAHTDQDCRHLNGVTPIYEKHVRVLSSDHWVCRECLGLVTPNRVSNPGSLTEKLMDPDFGPEDAGLSPLGERPQETRES